MSFQVEINRLKNVSGWFFKDGLYFIGHIFDTQGNYLPDEKGLDYLNSLHLLPADYGKLNGVFSVIYVKDETLYLFSDKSRFYPLFYNVNNVKITVSDSFYFLVEHCKRPEIDEEAKLAFLAAMFTFNNTTLVKQVKQVDAGELVTFSPSGINRTTLHRFCYMADHKQENKKQVLHDVGTVLNETGKRLAQSLQDKKVLLPLSGGYDSRLIACWLKENGITNVHCFTFGRKGYYEVDISRKVAKELGFDWSFIEFNDPLIKGYLREELFHQYYQFLAQGTSMFFMQDYFPLRVLVDKEIATPNSVAIPGHSGDGIGGSLLNKTIFLESKGMSAEKLLLANFCSNYPLSRTEKDLLQQQISRGICDETFSFSALQEDWLFREKLAKYIFNSSRAFSFFGMETRFPFWDNDLVSTFMSLPIKYRLNKNMYDTALEEFYFKKYGVFFGTSLTPTAQQLRKQRIKNNLRPYLPMFMKDYYRKKNDWTFYNEMTLPLIREMEEHKWKLKDNGTAFTYRILNWYLFKLNKLIEKQQKDSDA